jgi:hypothetical protein
MEFIIIAAIVLIQGAVFYSVLKKIITLNKFFPSIKKLSIRNKNIEFGEEGQINVDLITIDSPSSEGLSEIIKSTNSYLINNKGSAADFNIIKDITERHLDALVNSINSTISSPLYLGLAGTFFGIIYGLSFLDFESPINGVSVISSASIGSLIKGVITAMIASATGLILTIINSAWLYKNALYKNEREKNTYYDFIQSQLLPKLSKDVSDSLGSLKSNLDYFNNKFGENLINYKDSFQLLNDNLQKEKDFLEAIQEVGLNKLSLQIVNTFEKVSDASNEFHDFQQYQTELNKCVSSSIAILKEYNQISSNFENFNKNLDVVSHHIIESSDFYHEFKSFLERHFSEVEIRKNIFTESIDKIDNALTSKLKELSEKTLEQKDFYSEQWRSTVDILNKDIVTLFSKVSGYVQSEAESLKKYIATEEHGLQQIFESNKEFFKDFRYVEQLFSKFSSYAEVTYTHHQNVEQGIKLLTELLSNDASLIEVNKNLVEVRLAIEKLNITMSQQNRMKYEQESK